MDPYEAGKAIGRSPSIKTSVACNLVVVLDTYRDGRELALIHPYSRCVLANDVHELIITDEAAAKPGGNVNRVAGLGFMVIAESGVVIVGDEVTCTRFGLLGTVVGFDLTHYPNHMNVVLYAAERASGRRLGLEIGEELCFAGQSTWK
jgi:hypothetical protein